MFERAKHNKRMYINLKHTQQHGGVQSGLPYETFIKYVEEKEEKLPDSAIVKKVYSKIHALLITNNIAIDQFKLSLSSVDTYFISLLLQF